MIEKTIPANNRCPFCLGHVFPYNSSGDELLVLVERSPKIERVFHQTCFENIFGKPPYSDMKSDGAIKLEAASFNARVVCMPNLVGPKRCVYILAVAISLFAFGIFASIAAATIVTVSVSSIGYGITQGIEYYAWCRAPRVIQFE